MKNNRYRVPVFFVISMAVVFLLAACNQQLPTETEIPDLILTASPTEKATEFIPSLTPSPRVETVILITTQEVDTFTVSQIQESLERLIADSEYELVIKQDLSGILTDDVHVVVVVGEAVDVNGLALDYPDVSFVAVDNAGAIPAENVSVIGIPDTDQRQRAFMAGYLAALISDDYKVAALVPAEVEITEPALESFVVGVRFFCGICQPKYPPYQSFPQWETISVDYSPELLQQILDNFVNIGVEVLFLHGDLVSPTILTAIGEKGIRVVSDQSAGTTVNNYAGTVLSNPAPVLESMWEDILEGNNGIYKAAAVELVDRNSGLVTDGRYQLFLEMAADLQAGLVYPEAVP